MGVAGRTALVGVVLGGLCLAGCGASAPRRTAAPLRPCKLDIGGTLAAELPDGSLVVGAASHHAGKLVVRLRRVTQDCRVVRFFGTDGTATVSVASGRFGEIDALSSASDGRLVLAGGNGHALLVGRLLEDGRLDRSFGDGGWARVKPHEHVQRDMLPIAPTATSIAFGPSSSIFLGANDEGAHCCVRDFVSELTAAGTPVRTFGDDGSIVLPTFGGSYTTELAVSSDGRVYALGEYEQSGCGGPSIARIYPDGSLDRRFDASVARTVKRVAGKKLRFTPTLVAGAGKAAFALVGGLDKTCVPPYPPQRAASGGVALEILRSGAGSVETRFPTPDFFDSPAAIRLDSGRVVAAGLIYRANGKLKSAIVRAFRADGSAAGSFAVDLAGLPRALSPRVVLLPAADGGAWLVVGLPKETDLVPVRG